jgi:type II secretory pathway component PulF
MMQIDYMASDLLPRKPVTSFRLTLALAVIVFPLLGTMLFVVPRFEQIFKDFHTALPASTMALLYASRCCQNLYVAGSFLLVPIVLPILMTQLFWRPVVKQRRRWWELATVLVFVCTFMFIIVSLFAPMIALVQTASSPRH